MILRNVRVVRPGGAVQDFSDLTAAKVTDAPRWADDEPDALVLPFDREPSAAEQAKIRRRLVTADATEEARVTAYADARTALRNIKGVTPQLAVVVTALIHLLDDKLAQYGE